MSVTAARPAARPADELRSLLSKETAKTRLSRLAVRVKHPR